MSGFEPETYTLPSKRSTPKLLRQLPLESGLQMHLIIIFLRMDYWI